MGAGWGGRASPLGLSLATGALCGLGWQVVLGRRLRDPRLPDRRRARRWHFWVMAGTAAPVLGHIALNSALVGLGRR